MITIKSVADLNQAVIKHLDRLLPFGPFDLIVGVPRSGMLPATLLSTHLQLPLTDVDGYLEGRANLSHGRLLEFDPARKLKVLLVDDTINTGRQMRRYWEQMCKQYPQHDILRMAVYDSNKTKRGDVDFVCERCALPRAFQWNLWKHDRMKRWGVDLDGVLCRDPSKAENDRGHNYENFIRTAPRRFPLSQPVACIITARLERYREQTETWLNQNSIKYGALHMKTRDVSHARHKIDIINSLPDLELFIESDARQARAIAENVSIPVWCTDNQRVYGQ